MKTKKYVGKRFTHKANGSVVLVVNCMHHNTDGESIITENQQSGCISHLPFKNFKANYQPYIQREHKHIKYAIVDVTEDEVEVQITEQTHREDEFGNDAFGRTFISTNNFRLFSSEFPQNSLFTINTFYVRGENINKDDVTVALSHSDFQRFKKAVAEYNEYFKGD